MKKLQNHPYCTIFPPAEDDDAYRLTEDIRKHGQRVPIVLFENKILDGRSRYEVCLELGKKPRFIEFNGNDREALNYAVSMNLHRRHLNPSQKAAVASAIAEKLCGCGIPEQTAKATALSVSGASARSLKAFESIEESSKKTAEKIANGHTTIGHVEKKWEAPKPIDRVLRAAREATAAARRAMREANRDSVPQDILAACEAHWTAAKNLVERIEESMQ